MMLLLLASCNKEAKKEAVAETKTYDQLEKASWLLGEWGNKSPEGELTERWKRENDSVFKGESYFVTGDKDTVFAETIVLDETDEKLAYTVTVPDQNNAKPVRFKMTSITDGQIVFENPKHDFPAKITYKKIGNDSLKAEISGMRDGKPSSEIFAMKKQ